MKLSALVTLSLSLSPLGVLADTIQSSKVQGNATQANAIKAAFSASYAEYIKYASGEDELQPLSKKGESPFGQWGATLVDAISTAALMGLDDQVETSIALVKKIDFEHTAQPTISLFETNIRYIGGLLSAYELTGKKHKSLVRQANVVGKHVLKGWVGHNDIPYNTLVWNDTAGPVTTRPAIIAEAGTLLLELGKLSEYTKNKTYLEYAEKSMKAIINSQPVFPGLYSQSIDPSNNRPSDDYVTWGGGSDSFFEYLLKYGILAGTTDTYIETWEKSVASSIKKLIVKADGFANLTYLTDYSKSNGGNIYLFSHLGCFVAGNWILGGKVLGNQKVLNYGLKLAESCWNTYENSAVGIGPEVWAFVGAGNQTNGVTIHDRAFYNKSGFDYQVKDYVLRPEVLESVWYAYRITGDKIWQDRSWAAFQAIQKYCTAKTGATNAFTSLNDVSDVNGAQLDDSESFLYAETFKYLFMTQTDGSVGSLDKYVFNTEGHPLEFKQGAKLRTACMDESCVSGSPTAQDVSPSKTGPAFPYLSNLPGIPKNFADAPRDVEGVVASVAKVVSEALGGGKSVEERMLKRKDKDHHARAQFV